MSSVVRCGQLRGAAKRRPAKLYQAQDVGTRGVGSLVSTTVAGDQVRVCSTRRAKGPLAWTWTSSDGTCSQAIRLDVDRDAVHDRFLLTRMANLHDPRRQ